jgi:hypothetical protein
MLALALAALGCALPGRTPSQAPPAPTTVPDEPLPVSMSRAVTAGAEAGLWSDAQGLIRALRFLAGEAPAEQIFADQPVMSTEGTRVVRRAQVYLEDPANTEGRDELTRLLAVLVPSRETLDRFARPATAARSGDGLARLDPRRQGDRVECRSLWSTGFDLIENAAGVLEEPICLEFIEIRLGGLAHRVYYPAYWEVDAPERALFEPTRQALEQSLETYNAYGPNPVVGTDIVFTDLPAMEGARVRGDVLAAADRILRAERCHVAVFPFGVDLALDDAASSASGDERYGTLLQTIAHELFHCYQFTNLAEQESGPSGDAADWWLEGSAEYFGSVVYPSVNAEFDFLDDLDANSPGSSLLFYDYAAYAFFEYLDAQGGMSPQAIIDSILEQMPESGGYDEQQAALAGLDGMAEAFHAFGQTYLDKQLQDLGGGRLPVEPDEGELWIFPVGSGEARFVVDPLVLHRYRLSFADDARFDISQEAQGVGRNSARPASAPGAWAEIPPEVDTACGDSEFVLLATSVVPPGGDEVNLHLTTTGEQVEEDQPCDECLVGTWELDNGSYLAHMGDLWPFVVGMMPGYGLATDGAEAHPTDVFGRMTLEFNPDGTASGAQESWGIAGTATKDGDSIHAKMISSGQGEAAWKIQEDEASGSRYVFFEDGSFSLGFQIVWEDHPLDPRSTGGSSNDPIFLSTPQPFLCSPTTLTYYPNDTFGPIVFHRVPPESPAP